MALTLAPPVLADTVREVGPCVDGSHWTLTATEAALVSCDDDTGLLRLTCAGEGLALTLSFPLTGMVEGLVLPLSFDVGGHAFTLETTARTDPDLGYIAPVATIAADHALLRAFATAPTASASYAGIDIPLTTAGARLAIDGLTRRCADTETST